MVPEGARYADATQCRRRCAPAMGVHRAFIGFAVKRETASFAKRLVWLRARLVYLAVNSHVSGSSARNVTTASTCSSNARRHGGGGPTMLSYC